MSIKPLAFDLEKILVLVVVEDPQRKPSSEIILDKNDIKDSKNQYLDPRLWKQVAKGRTHDEPTTVIVCEVFPQNTSTSTPPSHEFFILFDPFFQLFSDHCQKRFREIKSLGYY